MNIDILKAAGVDYASGVRRFAGRARLYEKALSKFPAEGTFARLRGDYLSDDTEQLLLDAHEFKGMCGNIALTALYEAAGALVALLRSESWTRSELDAAYARLEAVYGDTAGAVRAAMEG